TPHELEAMSRYHNAVCVSVVNVETDTLLTFLNALEYVAEVEILTAERGVRVYPSQGQQITAELSQAIRSNNWQIDSLYAEHGRLDEVFRTLTINSSQGGA
ncbi:MAG: ABC transporter ATP-binding protein, partial [Gammaproteobacteria bacterium]